MAGADVPGGAPDAGRRGGRRLPPLDGRRPLPQVRPSVLAFMDMDLGGGEVPALRLVQASSLFSQNN